MAELGAMERLLASVDTIWVVVCALLAFLAQAGFLLIETGFTRARHVGQSVFKSAANLSAAVLAYWLIGFGLMFGSGAVAGGLDFFARGDYAALLNPGASRGAFVALQALLCGVAVAIVAGAMAERTRLSAYILYAVVIGAVAYPVAARWGGAGGWLYALGYRDYANAAAVNIVGGTAALVGAKLLGPRIGKYDKSGKSRAIPGRSAVMGGLGVFVVWLGWFGLTGSGVSSVAVEGAAALIGSGLWLSLLSGACGTLSVALYTRLKYGKPDVTLVLNGTLAALVAVSTGLDALSSGGAACVGLTAGLAAVAGIGFLEKKLRIDDPVGAVCVHALSGVLGGVLGGLFSRHAGLFYGHGGRFLLIQLLGVGSVTLWSAALTGLAFLIIRRITGLRISQKEERSGEELTDPGATGGYADFMPARDAQAVPVDAAIPVGDFTAPRAAAGEEKMTLLSIIMRQSKFERFKAAMQAIGVNGMTVTHVMGYGMQKGGTDEFYRGAPVDPQLLPKVKVEVVVCKIPVALVVETTKKALFTGRVGDGKIFVYDVENVVKVRTGEEGYDALQDD